MTNLELSGLRKTFGSAVAVEGTDLAVERGEFVALLGPSGCGKTTTLRMIAGFEKPDSGDIRISNTRVNAIPPHKRDIGLVFQSYALFPHMTVFENVAYGLRRRKLNRAEIATRVEKALEMVRLDGLDGRYARQLSGGQQQRVSVARSIVIQPSVLLLDEPLSNLDAKLRIQMRSELRRLQKELDITTILVTHDQEEALSMADKIVVMNAGRVEQVGTPQDIYGAPVNPFVANFIGECNFIPVEVVGRAARGLEVRHGGTTLVVADVAQEVRIGAKGTVMLRPENAQILSTEQAAPADANVLRGTVCSTTYLGAFRQYIVESEEQAQLILRKHGSRSDTSDASGDAVGITWSFDGAVFVPDAPGQVSS